MADQTQSPSSQPGVSLSGIAYPLQAAGTPFARALRELSLTVSGGSISLSPPTALQGRAIGRPAVASFTKTSGLFTLNEQLTAARSSAWPKYEANIARKVILPGTTTTAVAAILPTIEAIPSEDLNFSSVTLLLHMDGTNNSTTFTDSSNAARSITAYGNAKISTAQSKFGGAAALFDGDNDYLRATPATDLTFDGNFTIELWVYPLVVAEYMLGSSAVDSNTQIFRLNEGGSTGALSFYLNGTQVFSSTPAGVTANQWQHVAISRSGSSTRMFVNGTQIGSTNTTWTGTFRMDVIGKFFFGGSAAPGYDFNGYIDELRITKGVARYVQNFTPRPAAFPNS